MFNHLIKDDMRKQRKQRKQKIAGRNRARHEEAGKGYTDEETRQDMDMSVYSGSTVVRVFRLRKIGSGYVRGRGHSAYRINGIRGGTGKL